MTWRNRFTRAVARGTVFYSGAAAVLVYNVSLATVSFAFIQNTFPESQEALFLLVYGVTCLLAALSTVGVLLQLWGRRNWFTRWAYLMTTAASVITASAFLIGSSGIVSGLGRTGITGLILTGGIITVSMNFLYGGGRSVADALMHEAEQRAKGLEDPS